MGLTTASARQRIEFLDAKHIALDAQLVALVPDLKQHVGRPACLLTSSRKARLAVLLGTDTVATIEVDTVDAEAWVKRAPAIGNRSAGFLDMDAFLQQNARPVQKPATGSPAFSTEEPEEPLPAAETASPSTDETVFSVSKAEKRKQARVRAARDQSEAAALLLKKNEDEDAAAAKTQAAVTIQRVFGVALRARAQSPPARAATARSETFRKQLDDLELESLFEQLHIAGVVNMEMLRKMEMPTVLTVCGLHKADSGMRPRLTRAQEAALEPITAATPTALAKTPALPASATPKPTPAKRPVPPPATPAAARPTVYPSMMSKLEEYATSSVEFTKFLKQAVDMTDPPNRTEIKRSKAKMIETVEDFLRSFITSTNDIPVRKPASLDANQLVDLMVMIIEVNGGHESDEEGMAPLALYPSQQQTSGLGLGRLFGGADAAGKQRARMLRAIARGALRALAFCHDKAVVHGSVGSGSFLLSTFNDQDSMRLVVKLDNFGFARRVAMPPVRAQGRQQVPAGGADTPLSLGQQGDRRQLAVVLLECFLSALAVGGPSDRTSTDAVLRVLGDVFDWDVEAFRGYCGDEPEWEAAVALLDADEEAGWCLLRDLLSGGMSTAELAESRFCMHMP